MTKNNKISRRAFLNVAAVGALPMFIPGSVLGKDGFFPPSETINVGLIGWGTRHAAHSERDGRSSR